MYRDEFRGSRSTLILKNASLSRSFSCTNCSPLRSHGVGEFIPAKGQPPVNDTSNNNTPVCLYKLCHSMNICVLPLQRLNFQILLKPGFGQMYIYMPSAVRGLNANNTPVCLYKVCHSLHPWLRINGFTQCNII